MHALVTKEQEQFAAGAKDVQSFVGVRALHIFGSLQICHVHVGTIVPS